MLTDIYVFLGLFSVTLFTEEGLFLAEKKSFNNCKPQNASVDMDVLTNFFDDCKLAESG